MKLIFSYRKNLYRGFFFLALFSIILFRLPGVFVEFWDTDVAVAIETSNVILDGGVPYSDVVDHRPPLINYLFAIVFGLTGRWNTFALNFALILILVSSSWLVYNLGKITSGKGSGAFATLFFALLSTFGFMRSDNFAFHTEWIEIMFLLSGYYLIFLGFKRGYAGGWALGSGICFALAVFTKQQAAYDTLGAGLLIFLMVLFPGKSGFKERRAGVVFFTLWCGGGISVLLGTLYYFFINGGLEDFYFWVVTFNLEYYLTERHNILAPLNNFKDLLLCFNTIIFFLAGLWVVLKRTVGKGGGRRDQFNYLYLIIWLLTSLMGAVTGGREYPHYLIQVLPPLALISGSSFSKLSAYFKIYLRKHKVSKVVKLSLFCLFVAGFVQPVKVIQSNWNYYKFFSNSSMRDVSMYIKDNSRLEDKIFVWGFLPEIYVLSQRRSASVFTYGLVPKRFIWVPGTLERVADDLLKNFPLYIVEPHQFKSFGIRDNKNLRSIIDDYYFPLNLKKEGWYSRYILYKRKPSEEVCEGKGFFL